MLKISFLGDITCDRPFLQSAKKSQGIYDYQGAFRPMSPLLSDSDYVVGNLETVFAGSKYPYNKGLHYNTPDSFLKEVKAMGVHLLTTANNHCFDWGMEGLLRTQKMLEQSGIAYIGTSSKKRDKSYMIQEVAGVKIAFFSYTYGVNQYSDIKIPENLSDYVNLLRPCKRKPLKYRIIDKLIPMELRRKIKILMGKPTINAYPDKLYPSMIDQGYLYRIKEEIHLAKEEADLVVFCLHIGGQFNEHPGGYSEFIMNFLKDQGVDVVIGHHPHTIQRTEITQNGKVYAYSLGSFSLSPSAIYIHHECKPEYSQIIDVYVDDVAKKIQKVTFSFLKITEDDQAFLSVVPAYELYEKLHGEEKTALLEDIRSLYERITGKFHTQIGVQKEYSLF